MPPNPILGNLIRYVVNEVIDQEGTVFRTRLVKLLYLCDLEYYRSARRTLTGLRWIRYKFGPFAPELSLAIRGMGFDIAEEAEDFASGRGVRATVYPPPDPDKWLEPRAKAIVDRVLKRWGLEDLGVLLDYVYCDTEPMKDATFGEPLSFAGVLGGLRSPVTDKLEISAPDRERIRGLLVSEGLVSTVRSGRPGLSKGAGRTEPRRDAHDLIDSSRLVGGVTSAKGRTGPFIDDQE